MACTEIRARTPHAHDKIQETRRAHPSGYLINQRSAFDMTLHRSACETHLGDTYWQEGREHWGSLGNRTKILADALEEALEWARHRGVELKRCRSCCP